MKNYLESQLSPSCITATVVQYLDIRCPSFFCSLLLYALNVETFVLHKWGIYIFEGECALGTKEMDTVWSPIVYVGDLFSPTLLDHIIFQVPTDKCILWHRKFLTTSWTETYPGPKFQRKWALKHLIWLTSKFCNHI